MEGRGSLHKSIHGQMFCQWIRFCVESPTSSQSTLRHDCRRSESYVHCVSYAYWPYYSISQEPRRDETGTD